jgi:hypothetical protein
MNPELRMPQESGWTRLLRRIPRHYWIFAAGLSLVVLSASIFGYQVWQDRPTAQDRPLLAEEQRKRDEEAKQIAMKHTEKDRIAAEHADAAKVFTDIAASIAGSRTGHSERRQSESTAPAPARTAPPPTRTAPAPSHSLFDAIDAAVATLQQASIAFNAPKTLELAQTEQIQLLLDLNQPPEALGLALTSEGARRSSQVGVAARMEARLTGEQFQITATTPEEQLISSKGPTEWRWDIRPKATGPQELHLTLTALFDVEGKPGRRHIRTFDETIEVEVTLVDQVSGFLEKNWQWLWTAILVPVGFYFWKRRNPN